MKVLDQRIKDAYKQFMYQLSEEESRTTYHLTVTYQDRSYFEKTRHQEKRFCMSSIFSRYYLCRILPYIMNTQNFTRISHREKQPVTIAFPERHKDRMTYHHHAVISVKNEMSKRLDILCDKELIDIFPFKNIQSVRLTKRNPSVINYASKSYLEFNDDVLIYAPKKKVGVK